MAHGKRKRDGHQVDEQSSRLLGVGDALTRLRDTHEDQSTAKIETKQSTKPLDGSIQREQDDSWQTIDRGAKRRKRNAANFPAITHSANARLQSFVKISDIQNLVLYLLADGPAPQWVSVRHHKEIEKVVVLMVPGLESDMFDGEISLEHTPVPSSADNLPQSTAEPVDQVVVETSNGTESHNTSPAKQSRPRKMHISPDDYYPSKLATQTLPEPLKPFADIFPHIWPIKTPGDFNRMHSPLYAMLSAPIPRTKEEKKIKGPKPPAEGKTWQGKRTPLKEYIASKEDLVENNFAIHPAHLNGQSEKEFETARRYKACQSPSDGWIDILDISSPSQGDIPEALIESGSITSGRQLLVADCEMVSTTTDRFALARISLIDWDGKTVLDELVMPPDPVQDYLTPYSGITKELLDTATLTLPDIQEKLKELLTLHTVLAGHSLDSDFRALKISYPFIIDTALLYPHPKGPPQKSSLKWLSQKYLGREIQNRGLRGHDSVEDAMACLDLVKMKCEKGKSWGTPDASGEPIFKRLERAGGANDEVSSKNGNGTSNGENSQGSTIIHKGKTGAVVDWGVPMRGFGASATVAVPCENDAEVVEGVRKTLLGDETSSNIPTGGCDFVWARLRELEAFTGWWNKSKSLDATERLAKTLSSQKEQQEQNSQQEASDSQTADQANGNTNAEKTSDPTLLAQAVTKTVTHLTDIHAFLPPRTAYIIYTGSGDPRELVRLQALFAQHKKEFQTKKWDQLSVQWTDTEEQALKEAAKRARSGLGFLCVKGDGGD